MVKHIVMWNLKSELSKEEKEIGAKRFKEDVEALKAVVSGAIDIKVTIGGIKSSTAELLLESSFETIEALKEYEIHPEHLKIVAFAKTILCNRLCMDYISE